MLGVDHTAARRMQTGMHGWRVSVCDRHTIQRARLEACMTDRHTPVASFYDTFGAVQFREFFRAVQLRYASAPPLHNNKFRP